MELWIRSQDKEILLPIQKPLMYWKNDNGNDAIIYKESASYITTLAIYKSKERALEVLDEIQKVLQPKPLVIVKPSEEMQELLGGRQYGKTMKMKQDVEYKEIPTYVYEMPEE